MKRQSILFVRSMWVVILFTTLAACKDTDNRVFGDDFEFPALTDENTIRFTVNVVGDWRQLDIVASGGRMVIDWGNGRIQKIEDPSSMSGGVVYRYGNKGLYEVRIWAEELQLIDISGLLLPLSHLYLGNMPRMKSLALNSISDTRELDLNTFCPNVESINIGSFADLEHLEIEDCFRLRSIQVYSNPKLTSIEFGSHPEAESLYCSYNGFSSLSLKSLPALRDIDLSSNEVLSHLELNEKTSISAILIQGCAFQSITDILKCCPSLRELSCSYNKLTELDLSDNSNISELRCEHNQLTRLMRISCLANELVQFFVIVIFYLFADSCQQAIPFAYFVLSAAFHIYFLHFRHTVQFALFYFLLQSFVADNSGYQRNDTQQHQTYNKYPHDNITVTNQICAKLLINLYSIVYAIYFFRTFVCYLQNKHWRVN